MTNSVSIVSGILTATGTYLDRIIANTLIEVAERQKHVPIESLIPADHPPRAVIESLRRVTVALIAEVKQASPSKGVLINPFDPVALARDYAHNGAAMLSVLTDARFFQGSLADLIAVRAAVDLPILRKDFVIADYQLAEARAVGADAALLIVGVLDDAKLADLYAAAIGRGLTPLVEVHDAEEVARALRLSPTPPLIGVNNRDLRTFHTDLAITVQLAALIPPEVTLIAESGINSAAAVARMAAAGARAVLVGEAIVTAPDRPAKVNELSNVPIRNHADRL